MREELQDEFSFYQKIKQKIIEKEEDLNNFTKKGSKVYGFNNKFQGLFQKDLITEIEYARKKRDIITVINNYEQEVTRLNSLIDDMKDYICDFASRIKDTYLTFILNCGSDYLVAYPQKEQKTYKTKLSRMKLTF